LQEGQKTRERERGSCGAQKKYSNILRLKTYLKLKFYFVNSNTVNDVNK